MKNIKFVGHITTVSPVTISLPEQITIPQNSQGSYYIPASSLRGMIRSMSAFAICNLLKLKLNVELPVDTIYMLFNGSDTGRSVKLGGGFETLAKNLSIRTANPHISNFGNFAIAGKIKMGNAFCDPNANPIVRYGVGSRNHPFNRNPNLFNFVKDSEVDYLKDVMEADALTSLNTADLKAQKKKLAAQLKEVDADEKKKIFAEMAEIETQIKETKTARKGSSETILRTLDGFDAIDIGLQLDHRFTMTNPTDTELKFLLWTFYKASVNFRVGGHQNSGCGEISGHWEIYESSFENTTPKIIGTLTMDDDGFKVTGIEFNPEEIETAIIDGTFDFTVY